MLVLVWLTTLGISGFAQQTPTPTPTTTSSPSPSPKKESELKKIEKDVEDVFRVNSRRSSVSNPANFNTPGVFQIEYGYGGYYRGGNFLAQHAGTLVASFAATELIGFEFDLDTFSSQLDRSRNRATGIGDVGVGIQFDLTDETKTAPSFAVSYFAKLPTASVNKNLGTGRVDHALTALFSKKIGATDIDFNATYLINGKQNEKGFVTGGAFAFGVSRDLNKRFNLQGELYGESKDASEPQGLFAASILTYQLNPKTSFDVGLRFGLTPDSPRVGFSAGVTFGVKNFYKKRQ